MSEIRPRRTARKLKASLGGCSRKAGKSLALDCPKAFVVTVVSKRRREREPDDACAHELLVAHRSVLGQEHLAPPRRQVPPEPRQVDRRIAAADVDPVDHACR